MPDRAPTDLELPEIIDRYFQAHGRRDTEVALAAFTPEAIVVDDGNEFRGAGEIRRWLGRAASEFTFTRSLIDVEETEPGRWLVRNRLEGNFPGGVVDLTYRFTLTGSAIAALTIAP